MPMESRKNKSGLKKLSQSLMPLLMRCVVILRMLTIKELFTISLNTSKKTLCAVRFLLESPELTGEIREQSDLSISVQEFCLEHTVRHYSQEVKHKL